MLLERPCFWAEEVRVSSPVPRPVVLKEPPSAHSQRWRLDQNLKIYAYAYRVYECVQTERPVDVRLISLFLIT
jgi:hypothetical protein